MANCGICHICGQHKKLSFEHVPPAAAFNDQRILHTAFEQVLSSENLDEVKGKVQQRGAGAYTLCEKCNSDTGSWYAGAYASWAQQAMRIIILTRGKPSLFYSFNLFPLKVLKQVMCMFFSVNSPLFQSHRPDLVRFVLNRDLRDFPPKIGIYAFYTFSNRSRAVGATGVGRGFGSGSVSVDVLSEITFPPFGFVMTLGESKPPDKRLCEISSFSQFEYKDWRVGLSMQLPIMPIYTGFPGDYRTREQTLKDRAANEAYEAQLRGGRK